MESSILYGYHIFFIDKCVAPCSYIPDLMTNVTQLRCLTSSIRLKDEYSIFVSNKNTLYVGVEIPSGWNENADSGPRITFDEQLSQTHQNNTLTWNDWFDLYHMLQNQDIAVNEKHFIRIKCANETPCLFATQDLTTLKHPLQERPH